MPSAAGIQAGSVVGTGGPATRRPSGRRGVRAGAAAPARGQDERAGQAERQDRRDAAEGAIAVRRVRGVHPDGTRQNEVTHMSSPRGSEVVMAGSVSP